MARKAKFTGQSSCLLKTEKDHGILQCHSTISARWDCFLASCLAPSLPAPLAYSCLEINLLAVTTYSLRFALHRSYCQPLKQLLFQIFVYRCIVGICLRFCAGRVAEIVVPCCHCKFLLEWEDLRSIEIDRSKHTSGKSESLKLWLTRILGVV